MMQRDNIVNLVFAQVKQDHYPVAALPVISFDDRLQFHFNGGDIQLLHVGPAHTSGDAAVLFREHNAVHFGDIFNNTGYPFVDVDSGGDVDGMIRFCETVLAELDDDSVVIPGHGAVVGVPTLKNYIAMLKEVRNRVAALIEDGKSLEEVVAAKPTAEFDQTYGTGNQSLGFVDRVYTSLTKSKVGLP